MVGVCVCVPVCLCVCVFLCFSFNANTPAVYPFLVRMTRCQLLVSLPISLESYAYMRFAHILGVYYFPLYRMYASVCAECVSVYVLDCSLFFYSLAALALLTFSRGNCDGV